MTMTKIDFEKILIEFLNSPFNRQFDEKLKSALKEQGLEYKNGEIVKTQRRVATEAREAIFDDGDERIREALLCVLKSDFEKEITICDITVGDIIAWLEKQHSISDVPSREVILSIWQLGNDWKELTDGVICTEYGTQLDYIQKHWQESEYYLRSKQGK